MINLEIYCNHNGCPGNLLLAPDPQQTEREILLVHCPECGNQLLKLKNPYFRGKTTVSARHNHYKVDPFNLPVHVGWLIEQQNNSIYPLSIGEQTIGRESSNKVSDVKINTTDILMGGSHCRIEAIVDNKHELKFTLKDNNSLNGTKLGLHRLLKEEVLYLEADQILTLGRTSFVFIPYPLVSVASEIPVYLHKMATGKV